MEYLTTYINIYYMLTFIAASYFIIKHVTLPKKVDTAWWVLLIGAVLGWGFYLVDESTTVPILITTYAIGTSFYELVINWLLKKFDLK